MIANLMCFVKRTAMRLLVVRTLALVVLTTLLGVRAEASASPGVDGGEARSGVCEQWTQLGITLQEGDGVNGTVRALTVFQGELIVAGAFTEAAGVAAKNVAAWTESAAWGPLGEGVDFVVHAVAVWNGQLIVGGQVPHDSETPGTCLMRWDGEEWVSLGEFSLQPYYKNPTIHALAVHDGLLVAAGVFLSIDGEPIAGVATWDGNAWRALGEGLHGIMSLTTHQDQLYACGPFYSLGGYVARWDGKTWSEIPDGPTGKVVTMGVWQDELVVAGPFSSAGGQAAARIARWDGSAWHPLQEGVSFSVQVLGNYNGDLIAGGSFVTAGAFRSYRIARWNGSGWQPIGLGMEQPSSQVAALTVYNGELVAGGSFSTAGGSPARSIARWHDCPDSVGACCIDNSCTEVLRSSCAVLAGTFQGAGTRCSATNCPPACEHWQSMGFPEYGAWIKAVEPYNGGLVVGGKLPSSPSSAMNNIAWWDGSEWRPLGGGLSGDVTALCVYDGALYAGWWYNNSGRISRLDASGWTQLAHFGQAGVQALVEWDGMLVAAVGSAVRYWAGGDSWPTVGWSMNSIVLTLCVHQNELIAGGVFTATGPHQRNRIARFDSSTWNWQPLGSGMDKRVYSLFSHGGDLYAGGDFKFAGDVPAERVARWDGSAWHALGQGLGDPFHEGTGESVRALAVYRGQLIAGGFFTEAGGHPIRYVARWRDGQWESLGLGTIGTVRALRGWNHELIVGGSFGAAGPWASWKVARWTDCSDFSADLNGDGVVNALDLLILLAAWGPCADDQCDADLDSSGAVDVQDMLLLLSNWG